MFNYLFKFIDKKDSLITDGEVEWLLKKIELLHGDIGKGWTPYEKINNALQCLHDNGRLSRRHGTSLYNWYKEEYKILERHMWKLRKFYELGKVKRKEQNGEILRLKAEITRLKSKKQSRLEKIGSIVSKFKPGTSLVLNSNNEWTASIFDGQWWRIVDNNDAPAGLFKDPLTALKHLDGEG